MKLDPNLSFINAYLFFIVIAEKKKRKETTYEQFHPITRPDLERRKRTIHPDQSMRSLISKKIKQ